MEETTAQSSANRAIRFAEALREGEAVIPLAEVGCELRLADVYANVPLPPTGP